MGEGKKRGGKSMGIEMETRDGERLRREVERALEELERAFEERWIEKERVRIFFNMIMKTRGRKTVT